MKFADFTIGMPLAGCSCMLLNVYLGKAWTSDYGDPHDAHDFDFIYPISPLHNIPTNRKLPPTILLTADRKYMCYRPRTPTHFSLPIDDDRVVPLHSFKHAATLQYTLPHNPHPLLIRIDTKAGHGTGKSTDQRLGPFCSCLYIG